MPDAMDPMHASNARPGLRPSRLFAPPPPLQLLEINKAIDAAEANPARFRLSQAELSERRAWTLTTQRSVDSVRAGLNAPPPPSTTATPSARLAAAAHSDNERFLESEGQRQQTLLA